jgi:hypothetical protein
MTDDERREQWRACIRSADSESNYRRVANAVMAKADAELAQTNDNLKRVYDETSRLAREENTHLLAQLAADQLRGDVAYDRAVAAEQENARLREELRTEEQVSVALRRELERERALRAELAHRKEER